MLKSTKKIVDFNSSGSYDFILFVWLRDFHKCQNKLSSEISGGGGNNLLGWVGKSFLGSFCFGARLFAIPTRFPKAKLSNSTRIRVKLKHSKKIKVSDLFISLARSHTRLLSRFLDYFLFRLMVLFK